MCQNAGFESNLHAAAARELYMEKLIAELMRLFIPAGSVDAARLSQRLLGHDTQPLPLVTPDGLTRAIAIPFDKLPEDGENGHWTRLCEAASSLQAGHGFPAPAVSVSGGKGYSLWISLATPVPEAQARRFADLLRQAWLPGAQGAADEAMAALPPCLDPATGKWAAFIHPGMGASFAEEPWLEMAPPAPAQAAFLEAIESVGSVQFERAFAALQQPASQAPAAPLAAPQSKAGLLLEDATLEDIVRHLHARHIEPTFRHLIPPGRPH